MEITLLSDHTGAEARGVDLARPVTREVRDTLAEAFVERSVLVVREQSLAPQQVLAAVELFGRVFQQHNTRFAIPECPQIHYLSNQDRFPDGSRYIPGEGWHTDHSNDTRPPKATVLHAVTLPDRGGDTQFANMAAAWSALAPALQERLADLMAIHVYQSSHSARKLMALSDANKERVPNAVLHPIVRTHPENGRKSIYINPIRIEGILGLDHKEALPQTATTTWSRRAISIASCCKAMCRGRDQGPHQGYFDPSGRSTNLRPLGPMPLTCRTTSSFISM
jgi:taurine dioxygenase